MKTIEQFQSGEKTTRTVCNSLLAIGKTQEYIERDGLIAKDEFRFEKYKKVKNLTDDFYKGVIQDVLSSLSNLQDTDRLLFTEALPRAYEESIKDKKKEKDLKEIKKLCSKVIENRFASALVIKNKVPGKDKEKEIKLLSKDVFSLMKERMNLTHDDVESLDCFNRFSGYFLAYFENRSNMFATYEKTGSVSHRILEDNFPIFFRNVNTLAKMKEKVPELYAELENKLTAVQFCNWQGCFDFENIVSYFSQTGIDNYNRVLGGLVTENNEKIQGVNELINLFCQQHKEIRKSEYLMRTLKKQILSDRESASFIPDAFQSEDDAKKTLAEYFENESVLVAVSKIRKIMADFKQVYALDSVFVLNKDLKKFSSSLFGQWNAVPTILYQFYLNEYPKKTEAKKKEIQKKVDSTCFSISEIQTATDWYCSINDNIPHVNICDSISDNKMNLLRDFEKDRGAFLGVCLDKEKSLKSNPEPVKNVMDAVLSAVNFLSMFIVPEEYSSDGQFAEDAESVMATLGDFFRLYNKVRNFVTAKVIPVQKIKLNFENAQLANGWDRNKEGDCWCFILRRNGELFLGIWKKCEIPVEREILELEAHRPDGEEPYYEKYMMRQLKSANLALPKSVFPGEPLKAYAEDEEYLRVYATIQKKREDSKGEFWVGSYGSKRDFEQALIALYCRVVPVLNDWAVFEFSFKKPSEYENLNDFYSDVDSQSLVTNFDTRIKKSVIDEYVEQGKIYLFQIYNRDFSKKASGMKNLHTLYLENLFSDENVKLNRLRIGGSAELFYRPALNTAATVHKKGTKLVNRNTADGRRIPESEYLEIYRHVNGKLTLEQMSESARKWLPLAVVKDAKFDIEKDRRFFKPQYQLHLPLSFSGAEKNVKLNDLVNEKLKEEIQSINIIGIDRGERNLVYISVINQDGRILEQRSINLVSLKNGVKVDYNSKLAAAEAGRDSSRKSWNSISKIADLKKGYLSYVIHEICLLMVKYNAIVVLENLNMSFKRTRQKIEKSVYQTFESMLISKLSYLAFKNVPANEPGGILKGLQLAKEDAGSKNTDIQNGWIFYIPAAYTSQIDPVTGFSNFFRFGDLTNADKVSDFFSRFKSIRYNQKEEDFKFEFDYGKFDTSFKMLAGKTWVASSRGERIVFNRIERKSEIVKPTEELKKLFSQFGIDYQNSVNLCDVFKTVRWTDRERASFYQRLLQLFRLVVQLRNSAEADDYILSPVCDGEGRYFDSRNFTEKDSMPCDGDANGAYNIARQGIMILNAIACGKDLKHTSAEWIQFAQRQ